MRFKFKAGAIVRILIGQFKGKTGEIVAVLNDPRCWRYFVRVEGGVGNYYDEEELEALK